MRYRSALLFATLVANSCTPAFATDTVVHRSVTKAVTHTAVVRETRRTLPRRRFHEPRFALYVDPCVRGRFRSSITRRSRSAPRPSSFEPCRPMGSPFGRQCPCVTARSHTAPSGDGFGEHVRASLAHAFAAAACGAAGILG